ncbi:MAG: hypothetical protein V3W31_08655 [Thermodesulfobacteriota bacterium]
MSELTPDKEGRGKYFIYGGVFLLVTFFLLLDVLVGTLSWGELPAMLLALAALIALFEVVSRLWK